MKYLEVLRNTFNNRYINRKQFDLLSNLYDLIENDKFREGKKLEQLITKKYDVIFKEFNQDMQIYEVEDKRMYPRAFRNKDMLMLENLECLMQTKTFDEGDYVFLSTVIR